MVREDEVYRRYWMGKRSKTKAAVMEYLSPLNTKTQRELALIHDTTEASIIRHIRNLRDLGILMDTRGINPCIICDTNVYAVYPKYAISLDRRKKGMTIIGYICESCFDDVQLKGRSEE